MLGPGMRGDMKLVFLLLLLLLNAGVGSTASRHHRHHSRRSRFIPQAPSPSASLWAPPPPPTPGAEFVVPFKDVSSPSPSPFPSPSPYGETPDPADVESPDREPSPDLSKSGLAPAPTMFSWGGELPPPDDALPPAKSWQGFEISPPTPGDDGPSQYLPPSPASGGDDGPSQHLPPSPASGGDDGPSSSPGESPSGAAAPGNGEPSPYASPPAPPPEEGATSAALPFNLPPGGMWGIGGSGSGRRLSVWVMAAVVGSGVVAMMVFVSAMIFGYRVLRKRNGAAVRPWKFGMSGQMQKAFVTAIPAISRADVEAACEDFSNIIGSSPDSVVFKGTLEDGTEVAVTSIRMSEESWTPKSEIFFRLKVESLARMSHTHLVNLVSYCAEDEPFTRMLIFEYASNGTLFEHLHRKGGDPLSWSTRMRIIMGTAYGLQYMHHELQPPTSHLNFNSNAVYLTEDFAAKLAEFGVTKGAVVRSDRRRFRSSKSSGGMEYDDSEGSDRHSPDFEENVYNFGVFLLEVVTGRVPYTEKEGWLVDWAGQYISAPENLDCMVDQSLESFDRSQLLAICQVSRLCTDSYPHRRFTMKEATKMLAMSLKITPEIAAPKGSLLWAELEILS